MSPLVNLPDPTAEIILTAGNALIFDHLVRQQSKELLETFLACGLAGRRVSLLIQLVEYKGGVLVFDVKYLTAYLTANSKDFRIIPLLQSFLTSTIPLTDETRKNMLDILTQFSDRVRNP